MRNTLNIAVADNHADYREALSAFLSESGFNVILSAPARPQLLLLIEATGLPDVIIISCSAMYPESIDLVSELKRRFPSMKVLANVPFLHYLPALAGAAPAKGVIDGWIVKAMTGPGAIIKAITTICGPA